MSDFQFPKELLAQLNDGALISLRHDAENQPKLSAKTFEEAVAEMKSRAARQATVQ